MYEYKKIVEPIERIVSKIQIFNNIGFETQTNTRFQLGYILSGEKHFVTNEQRLICRQGDIFFIPIGNFYIENIISDDTMVYDQIALSFDTEHLNTILPKLEISTIPNYTQNQEDLCSTPIVAHAEDITSGVFRSINDYYNQGGFNNNQMSEIINLTNAIYTVLNHESEQLRNRIIRCMDNDQALFEKTIFDNIFNDLSINDLAQATNRSTTSFKNEFKRRFQDSPHRWLLHQRMTAAKMMLATTNESVAQIGARCTFENTSHFIKLYRSLYKMTPAQHRITMRSKGTIE